MEWTDILIDIFQICIIPLLGVLTGYLVKWINIKSNQIKTNMDDELMQKYTTMLTTTITDCVIATNQTYVESLKQQGKFDAEAQKIAFEKTLNSVLAILTDDAKEYLQSAYGDLSLYITKNIEKEVNLNK